MSEPVAPHTPFVPPEANVRELSVKALVMGSLLGIVFAMSSVYLGLKVGLTVSASIPVAVMSITLFRWLRLRGTILENNIAQTTGSAGESLAAGVAFTLPSLLLMGFELELGRIMLVALLGGLIGVLMMIPLRHGLIVKEHGKLAYPEGTACADVLVVGEKGGTEAKMVFLGFFVGFGYAFLNSITKLWAEAADKVMTFKTVLNEKAVSLKAEMAADVTPPMLGVGYIIGPKVASNMLAGGLLAFCVLMPLITMLGGDHTAGMTPGQIRHDYILYIGAGAVAAGGFVSLARSIPTIITAFRRGMGNVSLGKNADGTVAKVLRTEQDLSMKIVLGGSLAIIVAIVAAPMLDIDLMTAVLVVVFGFFFVTVSSRITGEIGSSSNPISGMTIATLLLTCGLFVLVGRTGVGFKAMALSTAALVCVAASNGGTISQDLKTGYLVGATPRHQQVAILVGVVTSAIVIGFTMLLMLKSGETFKPVDHPGIKLAVTSDTAKGPDGNTYKIAYQPQDEMPGIGADGKPTTVSFADAKGTPVARGKYLVDDAGTPMFFVDSAVGTAYPYRLLPKTGAFPTGLATSATGELCSPNDLVAAAPKTGDDGKPEAAAAPVAQASGETRVCRTVTDASGKEASSAVGRNGGVELGLDRQPYTAFILDHEFGGLPAGHYLAKADGQLAYETAPPIGKKLDAPKANLFALIIDGILGGKLPWGLVLIGVLIALILELCGVKSLSMAVGLYLPIAVSGGVFIGGVIRWIVDRRRKGESEAEAEFSPGMLMASGLIAGGSIAGVLNSGLIAAEVSDGFDLSSKFGLAKNEEWWPLVPLILMAAALAYVGGWAKKKTAAK